jgi:hypothetical protein
MALSFPLDFLPNWPGWSTEFDLMWRKEVSRQANGATRKKDLGTPLWHAKFETRDLFRPSELDYWRAVLNSMDGGEATFRGYQIARSYPILYPNGSWPTGVSFNGETATVHTVGGDNKSLRVDLLPVGYTISVGDFLSVEYATGTKYFLCQAVEAAIADGSGVTPSFEVRPHLPPGLAVDGIVRVKRPFCLMTIDTDTLSIPANLLGRGKISFEATECR